MIKHCLPAVIERILLTLWVGGLWAIGYLVVPVLFASLDDRQVAGMVAGQLFALISYFGLFAGLVLLALRVRRIKQHEQNILRDWRAGLLVLMMLLLGVGVFVIQPMMADLKLMASAAGGVMPPRFGQLHGLSSILYMISSVAGLALVMAGLGQRQGCHGTASTLSTEKGG